MTNLINTHLRLELPCTQNTNFDFYRNDPIDNILSNPDKAMIAQDSNAENAKTAPLANASIAQPANDAFDFIAPNNNEDTATCASSNLTNTALATNDNAEENIATDDEEKIGDEGVTLSLNTVLPSFDLTAEEELKIHMLFQVREKVG